MSTAPASNCFHKASCSRGVAQRRRAFRDGAEPLDIFFGEEQIVRASFDGNIRRLRAGLRGQRYAAARADVNDVQLRAGFARQQRGALDGFHFGDHRPRCEKIALTLPPLAAICRDRPCVISWLSA